MRKKMNITLTWSSSRDFSFVPSDQPSSWCSLSTGNLESCWWRWGAVRWSSPSEHLLVEGAAKHQEQCHIWECVCVPQERLDHPKILWRHRKIFTWIFALYWVPKLWCIHQRSALWLMLSPSQDDLWIGESQTFDLPHPACYEFLLHCWEDAVHPSIALHHWPSAPPYYKHTLLYIILLCNKQSYLFLS